jgi:hypothetical protein
MNAGATQGFASTYADARERFVDAAQARGLRVEHHVHPVARGVQGEELSIDVAVMGGAAPREALVLLSGTHGAEGFCGSGCQVNFLRDDAFAREVQDAGVRVVFVHALNPYGFSHLRRTNEDNVDLNRNFRDFSQPIAPNVDYAEVHGFMVPSTWPPSPANEGRLMAYMQARGERALQNATSGGQCEFPDGLFYGGVRAAWSNTTLRGVLREHGAGARTLGLIDFHTGLGPYGHAEKILSARNSDDDVARAKAWWGDDVTSFHDGSSTSAPLTGVNYNAVYDECPGVAYAGIALEYGTLPVMTVLQALRGDQWLQNHPEAPDELRRTIKQHVRDAFYQDADDWKRMVHEQAVTHTRRAIYCLAQSR